MIAPCLMTAVCAFMMPACTRPHAALRPATSAPPPPPQTETIRPVVRNLAGETVTVTARGAKDGDRLYTLRSSHPLRKGEPASGQIDIAERAGQPRMRSGDVLFDALFALAMAETLEASVASIRTGGFNGDKPTPCACFETGAEWTYVWTRDTAYSMRLALGYLDPLRAVNSLNFKLSAPKPGLGPSDALQAVQDTGTGGSWPISTDRVSWFLGARTTLAGSEGPETANFRTRVQAALGNTLQIDREFAFDPQSGLYRGEQSFLDWREQSYPLWTKHDPAAIAASLSLSTNVLHLAAMRLAETMASPERAAEATQHRQRANALQAAIARSFWDEDAHVLRGLLGPPPTRTRYAALELLGTALAVLEDVLPAERAAQAVANYPRLPAGSPVVWPQTPDRPVYHNRGVWPFVSAFSLLAAKKVGNESVFDLDMETLLVRAALNLSNMENFDALTGSNHLRDGPQKGPVINSRRQLWSVAGFLGAMIEGVFGVGVSEAGILISPFVTPQLHKRWLGGQNQVALRGLRLRGRRIDVVLNIPVDPQARHFLAEHTTLNGQTLANAQVTWNQLGDHNRIEVFMRPIHGVSARMRLLSPREGLDPAVFAPVEPDAPQIVVAGKAHVVRVPAPAAGVAYHLLRNGKQASTFLAAADWASPSNETGTVCYELVAAHADTGVMSHPSQASCVVSAPGVLRINADHMRAPGVKREREAGREILKDFGARTSDVITVTVQVPRSGRYQLAMHYANGLGIQTGIASGVKRFWLEDTKQASDAQSGVIVMPQLRKQEPHGRSTTASVKLQAGRRYRFTLRDGFNMSYLDHFTTYDHEGGSTTPHNRVDIAALELTFQASESDH